MMVISTLWLFLCIQHGLTRNISVNEKPVDLLEKSKESPDASNPEGTNSVSNGEELKLEVQNEESRPRASSLIHPHHSVTSLSSEISSTSENGTESGEGTGSSISTEEVSASDTRIPEASSAIKSTRVIVDDGEPSQLKRETADDHLPAIPLESSLHTPASVQVQEAKLVIGLKETADATSQTDKSDAIDESDKKDEGRLASPTPPDADASSTTGKDDGTSTSGTKAIDSETSPPGDNMPSFNEWTLKRLAEQEQKGGNAPASTTSQGKTPAVPKIRQKNYASADCGAKIIGTNAEAQSSCAVLNGYHDEYMLNPCAAKIWLVIELCEPVQAKKIEIANFELFSSSPREFSVYSSDRYPSRDWNLLGTFEARDEKNIQGFSLDQKPFHKFVKIEFASHYGAEHYCPLSLVRLFGASELEVLDTDDDNEEHGQSEMHDQDNDSLQDIGVESQAPNLFGSAKDAVMSIVKKAAEALSRDKNSQGTPLDQMSNVSATDEGDKALMSSPVRNASADQCVTLVHSVRDDGSQEPSSMGKDVSDEDVDEMLSCSFRSLAKLLKLPMVRDILGKCSLCEVKLNLTSNHSRAQERCRYLRALVGEVRFSALCHLHKIRVSLVIDKTPLIDAIYPNVSKPDHEFKPEVESKGAVPSLTETTAGEPLTSASSCGETDSTVVASRSSSVTPPLPETISIAPSSDIPNALVNSSQSLQELIQPTKTLKGDDADDPRKNVVSQEADGSLKQSESDSTVLLHSSDDFEDRGSRNESLSESDHLSKADLYGESVDAVPTVDSTDSTVAPIDFVTSEEPSESVSSVVVNIVESSFSVGVTTSVDSVDVNLSSQSSSTAPSAPSSVSASANRTNVPTNTQKESVFVRLSNRIKALELNMSLSSQYLEELSQRYRKQMEEMQRAFNKTIGTLNETARKAHEQDLKQQEVINSLQAQIDNLCNNVNALILERNNVGIQAFEPYVFLIFLELVVAACMYAMLRRHSARYFRSLGYVTSAGEGEFIPIESSGENNLTSADQILIRRRNSFAGHSSPSSKPQRRASEEALNISGTYADLMIVEPIIPIMVDQPRAKVGETKKKQRRHKKNRDGVNSPPNDLQFAGAAVANSKSDQEINKSSKNARMLHAANASDCVNSRGKKSSLLPLLASRVNSGAHWQMPGEEIYDGGVRNKSNSAKVTKPTTRENSAGCSYDGSSFVHKQPACNLLCNGLGSKTSTNGVIPNGRMSATMKEDRESKEINEFSVKRVFNKWFWFSR